MRFLARLVRRYPKTVATATIIITLLMALVALRITRSASLEENIPRSNKRLATYLKLQRDYAGGNSVVIILSGQDVFAPDSIRTIDRMTRALQVLEGVTRVTSLTNAAEFRGTADGLESGPLIARVPATAEEAEDIKRKVLADPWYAGRLVDTTGQSAIIVATLANMGSMGENSSMLHKVQAAVEERRDGFSVDYAGSTVMQEQIDRFLTKDLALLFPAVLACIVLILLFTFKSVRGIVLPLLTVLMSIVWTIGLMALVGRPLSLISNVLPVLLVAVGSAYGIHIVARFGEEVHAGADRGEAVETAVRSTGFSVWMAALTTMAGFGSLALSKMKMIVDFGIFSAVGTLAAFVISITFIPALLALLPVRSRRIRAAEPISATEAPAHGRLENFLGAATQRVLKHRWIVAFLVTGLVVLSVLGWPRIVASFSPSEFLPDDSPHRHAEALVDAKFGGSAELDVLVRGDLNDPALLGKIAAFQSRMEEMGVGQTLSVVDLLARVNRAFHEDDPAYEVPPSDPALVPQFLFLLTMSTDPGELAQFMTADQQEARITGRISNVMPTADRGRLVERLEAEVRAIFGSDAKVEVSGTPVLELTMMDLIRNEQMVNIASSLLAVFLLVAVAFRSITAGLACLVPIAGTIAMAFGLMGWVGIRLNTATAVIASLASGIGVDYGIHFYQRYVEERGRMQSVTGALVATARSVGVPIVANALAVGAGFAALLLSNLSLFRSFGGLIALCMVLTAAGALTVLPVLFSLRRRPSRKGKARRQDAGNAEDELNQ